MQSVMTRDAANVQASVLNKALLDQYRGRKNNLLERLINAYLEEAPRFFSGMRGAAESGNFAETRMNAHALKSSSHNLGAVRLSKVCQELESAAVAEDAHAVAELIARAGPEFFEAEQALRTELLEVRRASGGMPAPAPIAKTVDEDWF